MNKEEKKKRKYDIQMKVWNLRCLEERLVDSGQSLAAYTIRQVLDLISSNWRKVKEYKELEIIIK